MSRLVWVGVGAVGGIYAYRKGEQAVEAVRAHGLVQYVAVAAGWGRGPRSSVLEVRADASAVVGATGSQAGLRVGRFQITRADEPQPLQQLVPRQDPAAIMGSDVVDITDARSRARAIRRRKAR